MREADKYAEVMKDSPIQAALGSTVFFYAFRKRIVETFDSLFGETTEGGFGFQQTLEQNGVGINQIYAIAKGDVTKFKNYKTTHFTMLNLVRV